MFKVCCNSDQEIYLLFQIGIVQMNTNDFVIHASQYSFKPVLDKKFESTIKFINNFHDICNSQKAMQWLLLLH